VELSRHAKRRLRLYKLTAEQAEAVVRAGEPDGHDEQGNPRFTGVVGDGRVRVVVAADRAELIITVYRRRT
jgi:hypothetical protein